MIETLKLQVHGEQGTLSDPRSDAGLQSLPDGLQFLDVLGGLGLLHDGGVQLGLSACGLLGQSGRQAGSQPRLVVFLLQGKNLDILSVLPTTVLTTVVLY